MITLLAVFGWFVTILTLSTVMRSIYRQVNTPGFKFVLDIVLFIGVVIHELAHALSLLCMGVMPTNFMVRYRSRYTGTASPHGEVKHKRSDDIKLSFLQGFFTALAPLYVSTFTFLFMLDVIFNMDSPDMMKLVAVIVMVSVLFGSYPSNADINGMIRKFKNRPEYSWYQLLLAILSVAIVVFYVDLTFLILPFEVMYYILYCLAAIAVFLALKLTALTVKALVLWVAHGVQEHKNRRRTLLAQSNELYRPDFNPMEEVDW